jgi:primosomal protein N' (replication factor Y)
MAPLLESGMQVLMLVPEIGLTPQLVRRFSKRLGIAPVVYHSGLSEGQRLAAWAASRSGHARLMLGTRSALFMPMVRPGLIIMDESHDASFKQQDGFRFSARDVAVQRASRLGVPVVLGTATPSLETVNNALQDRYTWSRLRHRATGALSPAWKVMDMRQKPVLGGLLEEVLRDIGEVLEKGEQVLVFLNRRGYAPVLLCHECGWHGACSRCDANLTWHRSARLLACHHCGHRQGVPAMCPECSADALQGAGEGTQQLERFLARRCPGYPMYRFDRDAVSRKGAFEALYEKVRNDGPCLMVGTQMLAKGHHFPLVTRVVIVNPDQSLYSGDYRALERLGQLLVQVAGRAGREDRPGEVILQTHHPDHPLLETLFAEGYEAFARCLLEDRQLAGLPPYSYQAVLRAEATRREPVSDFLEAARDRFSSRTVKVYGPYPAQMEKRGGRMRWYLLLQDDRRPRLQAALDEWVPQIAGLPGARQVRWSLDVDPQEF